MPLVELAVLVVLHDELELESPVLDLRCAALRDLGAQGRCTVSRFVVELPERCWILTHIEWKDDEHRQMFEVITSETAAEMYRRGDPGGYQIAEYRLVRPDDTAPTPIRGTDKP